MLIEFVLQLSFNSSGTSYHLTSNSSEFPMLSKKENAKLECRDESCFVQHEMPPFWPPPHTGGVDLFKSAFLALAPVGGRKFVGIQSSG